MDVRRDEDTYSESQLASNFQSDRDVAVTVNAILVVPNKAVIGIVELEDQDVDEKVACVPLLQNDFTRRHQFSSFVRAACNARGPFGSIISTLQTGGKVQDKKRFLSGNVSMNRDNPPITAHLITLDEPFELSGTTTIQY